MDEFRIRADPYGTHENQGIGYEAPPAHYCAQCDTLQSHHCAPDKPLAGGDWDPDAELSQMLTMESGTGPLYSPPVGRTPHRPPAEYRENQPRYRTHAGKRRIRPTTVLITAIVACTMSMLGWSISYSYDQLHTVAALFMPDTLARWWPWMLYGPWLAAGMSIMRAALQHRTARWSWTVIVTASVGAVALCVGNSSKSLLMMAVAGIPPLTALACFQELVSQFAQQYRPQHAMNSTRRSKRA
ncbi:DUF2637 domain-containing protein [Streptomyces sp. S.PB5]|uniref:DUF2637 domain-containing protein n=1 Tax=Streptomyces sp. S.PB5 TaxID=3020844 RepID=UPI0025AFCCF9|nr:DUF2637 domain-containing protein [Streptomyces sp. S.PB5]MDN3026017.1 DUF2637 domain-containing protein [Streptomyces sp. S.PB5]